LPLARAVAARVKAALPDARAVVSCPGTRSPGGNSDEKPLIRTSGLRSVIKIPPVS
jgi:hypothetical protein